MKVWELADGSKHIGAIECQPYRIVEDQSRNSTRKLVDTLEEQKLLEEMIEESKPPAPTKNKHGSLHWLLFTPFRYPPRRHGSRFSRHTEQSLFYGSNELKTAMAEIAFRQLLHNNATDAKLAPVNMNFTHVKVHVKTEKGVLLTEAPFKKHRDEISNPLSSEISQTLGTQMRNDGVEAFTFFSARNPGGKNTGMFSVDAFAKNKPLEECSWKAFVSKEVVEFTPLIKSSGEPQVFSINDFKINGKLPFAG